MSACVFCAAGTLEQCAPWCIEWRRFALGLGATLVERDRCIASLVAQRERTAEGVRS